MIDTMQYAEDMDWESTATGTRRKSSPAPRKKQVRRVKTRVKTVGRRSKILISKMVDNLVDVTCVMI